MGLRLNAFDTLKPTGGNLVGRFLSANARRQPLKENFNAFGKYVSMPQGYQDTRKAVIPTLSESFNLRCVIQGASSLTNTQIQVPMVMAATVSGEGFLYPDAEVGKTMWATVSGEGTLTPDARNLVSMAANIDAGARPSAYDISQEVWQSQKTSFTQAGSMGKTLADMDAAALANAIITDPRFLTVAKFLGLK